MLTKNEQRHLALFIRYILISIVAFIILTLIHSWLTSTPIHAIHLLIPIFASTIEGFILARNRILRIELIKQANTDALTGAYNRLYFDTRLKQAIDNAKRYKHIFSIIYLDLDFFKKVNDEFGHNAGDEVLKDFSRIAAKVNRESDVFARFGGEEFIILAHMANKDDAYALYSRIQKSIKDHYFNKVKNITFSAGIAEFNIDNDSADTILERADGALYAAKENGRDCAVIAD